MEARAHWQASVAARLDAERVIADATTIWDEARWVSTERLHALVRDLAAAVRAEGAAQAEVLTLPADGISAHGGWVMPLAWSPRAAVLELLADEPGVAPERIVDYRACPHHLAVGSGGTPPGGLDVAIVALDEQPTPDDLAALRGKLALLAGAPSIGLSRRILAAGGVGWIADHVPAIRRVREPGELDDAVPWYNYHIDPAGGAEVPRPVGIALSPAQGRALRARLAATPELRARLAVEIATGADAGPDGATMPVLSVHLPGRSRREILITAHIDEPGANDNASGAAMALEIVRVLGRLARERGRPLACGVRVLCSVELRAIQALVERQPKLFANGIAGIDIDMVGADPAEARCPMYVTESFPGAPDIVYPALREDLDQLAAALPELAWRSRPGVPDDNGLAGPGRNLPVTLLVQGPDRTYHTSLDRPERLHAPTIRRWGIVLGGLVGALADADAAIVSELVDSCARYGRERIAAITEGWGTEPPVDAHEQVAYLAAREAARIRSCLRLLPDRPPPFGRQVERLRAHIDAATGLLDTAAARERAEAKVTALRVDVARRAAALPPDSWADDADLTRAGCRVPEQAFAGFLGGDGLSATAADDLASALGQPIGWAAPNWLQCALLLASGKRSLREIAHALGAEGYRVPTQRLITTFDVLAEHRLVRYREMLTRAELVDGLQGIGLRPGMTVVMHTGLSRFGYIDGGAEAVIEALEQVLGDEGTLCMPTHSLSWLGQRPYDPATSPSLVGAVSEAFRQREGVLRSAHPTHSVAVKGPRAAELIAGHDERCAPLGADGFWGRLAETGGHVLMLAPLRSCTLLHAGELLAGIEGPSVQVPMADGRIVEVPSMPWHVDWFDRAFARLGPASESRKLGEDRMHLFPAGELVSAAAAELRHDPDGVAPAGCRCAWCEARPSPARGAAAESGR